MSMMAFTSLFGSSEVCAGDNIGVETLTVVFVVVAAAVDVEAPISLWLQEVLHQVG